MKTIAAHPSSREGGGAVVNKRRDYWIPAFARVKKSDFGSTFVVMAAPEAAIQ
jgi:hypothetical protein